MSVSLASHRAKMRKPRSTRRSFRRRKRRMNRIALSLAWDWSTLCSLRRNRMSSNGRMEMTSTKSHGPGVMREDALATVHLPSLGVEVHRVHLHQDVDGKHEIHETVDCKSVMPSVVLMLVSRKPSSKGVTMATKSSSEAVKRSHRRLNRESCSKTPAVSSHAPKLLSLRSEYFRSCYPTPLSVPSSSCFPVCPCPTASWRRESLTL